MPFMSFVIAKWPTTTTTTTTTTKEQQHVIIFREKNTKSNISLIKYYLKRK
jgi:hypothetical protein